MELKIEAPVDHVLNTNSKKFKIYTEPPHPSESETQTLQSQKKMKIKLRQSPGHVILNTYKNHNKQALNLLI